MANGSIIKIVCCWVGLVIAGQLMVRAPEIGLPLVKLGGMIAVLVLLLSSSVIDNELT